MIAYWQTTMAMLQLLQNKLDQNVRRLDSLFDCNVAPADTQKEQSTLLLAQAHSDICRVELSNLSLKVQNENIDDERACKVIQHQIESSDDRNISSALLSFEKAIQQSDEAIMSHIDTAAEAIEAIIPALENKLDERKEEMAESHDSSRLLEASVESNYRTMRDGYLELIKRVYIEASIQWKSLLQLQEPNTRWNLEKLQKIIEETKDSPELLQRREEVYLTAQTQLDHFCEQSYEKIKKSSMYQEKEQLLRRIDAVKRKIFEHKKRVVQDKESVLSRAEVGMDGVYMNSAQEINEHLLDLQNFLHQLVFYERRLTQLLVVTFRRELRMDRLSRAGSTVPPADNKHIVGHSNTSASSSGSAVGVGNSIAPGPVSGYSADSDLIVQLGQQTMRDLHCPFQIGTMLRSLAESCDLPAQDTERLLHHVLFDDQGCVP